MRGIGHQRPEGCGTPEEADEHRLHHHVLPVALRQGGKDEADAEGDTPPIEIGTMMPNLSATLPITKPPAAKPMKVAV